MKTVAIIPAFNEYQKLSQVIKATAPHVDHIIVVDDGSEIMIDSHIQPEPGLTVLRHAINLGKGAALKTGMAWAEKRDFNAVVFLDADGQHEPNEIPRLLKPLSSGQAEVVFGVREFQKNMPLVAKVGNIFLTAVIRVFF